MTQQEVILHWREGAERAVRDTDMRIEPITLTSEALNDRYSTLANEIRTYGILV